MWMNPVVMSGLHGGSGEEKEVDRGAQWTMVSRRPNKWMGGWIGRVVCQSQGDLKGSNEASCSEA